MPYAWPLCQSCGDPLTHRWRSKRQGQRRIYCSTSCVPASLRAANGRKAREIGTARARLRRYRAEVKRLQGLEKVTGEDLLASFAAVGNHDYGRGYSCCESKWRRRVAEATATAEGAA